MQRRRRFLAALLALLTVILVVWVGLLTRARGYELVTQPAGQHTVPSETPADYQLAYEEVNVTTADGLRLVGWYLPSQNGATIIAQHGYKNNRGEMLNEAVMLTRHGYGLLITTVRAHDHSDGEEITFGLNEMQDLEAWYQYLISRPEVDPQRIGALGNSLGGAMLIRYVAQNQGIKALVTQSAFSSLDDTVAVSVKRYTGLPAFPFAPLIVFWAEQKAGFDSGQVNSVAWIGKISPRPVLLMQGGADTTISPQSGERLYAAAGEPKEFWFEPALDHGQFDTTLPADYEARVVSFFDRHLLNR